MAGIRSRSSASHRRTHTSFSFRFPHSSTQRAESTISLPDRMIPTRRNEFVSSSTTALSFSNSSRHHRAKSMPCLATSGISHHGAANKELLDYRTILLQDSEEDLHVKDVVLNNFKINEKSNAAKNEEQYYDAIVRSKSCLEPDKERLHRSLCQHTESLRVKSAKLNDSRRPGFKRINCPRVLQFEAPSRMSKQFCDILGTKACKDCARVSERLLSIKDYDTAFPDISVSSFQLCTKSDELNMKTTPLNSQSCDAWERYKTQSSWPAHRSYARNWTKHVPSRCNSPVSRTGSRVGEITDLNDDLDDENAAQSLNEDVYDSDLESEVDIPIPTAHSPPTRAHRPSLQNSDYFYRKYRPNTSRGETPESLRSMTPVHAEIEADKRRIMEYVWRLLAPKPPQIDVRDMNVSVYTPKAIPGIKIIEDGDQETIIVQRPPEIRDHMW